MEKAGLEKEITPLVNYINRSWSIGSNDEEYYSKETSWEERKFSSQSRWKIFFFELLPRFLSIPISTYIPLPGKLAVKSVRGAFLIRSRWRLSPSTDATERGRKLRRNVVGGNWTMRWIAWIILTRPAKIFHGRVS